MTDELVLEVKGSHPLKRFKPCVVTTSVRIATFLSETQVLVVFERQHDDGVEEDPECELVFPLAEGSTVCGYAVDVNGTKLFFSFRCVLNYNRRTCGCCCC